VGAGGGEVCVLAHLAYLCATVFTAADVARCESSHAWADGAAVLQVGLNRARRSGRTLLHELTRPAQFARGCPAAPRTWHPRHLVLGWQAVAGTLAVPAWARRAMHYTGPADRAGMCQRWRVVPAGKLVHVFCAPAGSRED